MEEISEVISFFNKNFPFIVREKETVKLILTDKENKFFLEKKNNTIIGVSVINKNTIILLSVDENYRNLGIGSKLLLMSENYIKNQGYKEVMIGAGKDYLMPGVPTNEKVYKENLSEENIYLNVNNKAKLFFEKRGYFRYWEKCNCFDMRLDLTSTNFQEKKIQIGDTINNIKYEWATLENIYKIKKCTEDAEPSFTKYYLNKNLYLNNNEFIGKRVLVAKNLEEIVGVIIISSEVEGKGLGSVGCTAVKEKFRNRRIGTNLVYLGTKYLKENKGLKNGFIGYTYSGLDKMYGKSGYKICLYYFMAKKKL